MSSSIHIRTDGILKISPERSNQINSTKKTETYFKPKTNQLLYVRRNDCINVNKTHSWLCKYLCICILQDEKHGFYDYVISNSS